MSNTDEKLLSGTKGTLGMRQLKSLRLDGWANLLTGLGTAARDKLLSTFFTRVSTITDEELEALFDGDDMAARVVEAIPDDAMRQGFTLKVEPDDDSDAAQVEMAQGITGDVMAKLDDLGAVEKLSEAWVWGRLFGGGAVFMVTDDPGEADDALDPERVTSLISLMVLDKRDLTPHSFFTDALSPNFGEVETFTVSRTGQAAVQSEAALPLLIHSSRLILFEGERTTRRRKVANGGWSHSVLQRPCATLRNFNIGWDSNAHLLTDSAQAVFKMDGLIEMLSSGGKQILQDRMAMVDMGRSVARALVIDAEKEEFERKETTFAGHADVLDKWMLRLAAAYRMPVTKLMGQSPAGMDATGEGDQTLWDNEVKAQQIRVLKPALEKLIKTVMHAQDGPTNGQEPEVWQVVFNPLRQMSEGETATTRKTVAETDALYINAGVVTPDEVGLSRFRAAGFSADTVIDLELRKQLLEMDNEKQLAPAPAPAPAPPPAPEPPPGDAPEVTDPEAADPSTAFNGAQVAALQDVLNQVIAGELPRETAAHTLSIAFPLTLQEALALINTIPEDFVKTAAPADVPPPFPPSGE